MRAGYLFNSDSTADLVGFFWRDAVETFSVCRVSEVPVRPWVIGRGDLRGRAEVSGKRPTVFGHAAETRPGTGRGTDRRDAASASR
jgi:hypothetical protein